MSGERASGRKRMVRAAAAGTGAAALAAGWVLQHRSVTRSLAGPDDVEAEGLTFPGDLTTHDVLADDGGRIHVVERGSGPTLVLLHGFMLSSALWAHQLRDLSESHRVIAADLRGHGQSDGGFARVAAPDPRAEIRMAAAQQGAPAMRRMADDVLAVLRTLDVEHAVVVGHSMGGMVALQLVHDAAPDEVRRRIAGLVLVSTTGGPFSRLPGLDGMARLVGPVSARALHLADRWGVRTIGSRDVRWWLTRLGFGADAPPAQVRFVESLHLATPGRTVGELLPSLALFDLSGWLGSMELPVLVVVGSHDRLTPPHHALRTASALPHAQLVELPRCGHMPMIERRREFARMVDEFATKIT
jgi:pimeloyl-ACP methyl ester carboxylesterase